MRERRRSTRRPAGDGAWESARLRTGHSLTLINVGHGGLLVESGTRLLPGATVELLLTTATVCVTRRALVLRCSVVSLGQGRGMRYRGALAFVDEAADGAAMGEGLKRERDREASSRQPASVRQGYLEPIADRNPVSLCRSEDPRLGRRQ